MRDHPPRQVAGGVAASKGFTRPEPGDRADRRGLYDRGLKRWFDLAAVILMAPAALPLILLLALCVAMDGHGPFFRQKRVGRGGRVYTMWKLRSMVHDAEARLEAHLLADPAARLEWDVTQKLRQDPRITRFGRFLRKTSLDELPQLWNVLTGDMSLVGPRPMLPDQQHLYPGTAYYALRPGITGPWQVTSRHTSGFSERAHYDAAYLSEMSLLTDLRLLGATVGVVVNGTGC
ncbi:sugar transferase [Frigidibacter oleivorans]|uniref:sugar transferase n=1 Tax=Frigidibacter oleivorans TaxID=2487129 RepID=UPI001F262A66|nr:sugar transferase [Frigidibacter oleivorans]